MGGWTLAAMFSACRPQIQLLDGRLQVVNNRETKPELFASRNCIINHFSQLICLLLQLLYYIGFFFFFGSSEVLWLLGQYGWIDGWMDGIHQTDTSVLSGMPLVHRADYRSDWSIRARGGPGLQIPASHMFTSIRGAVIQHLKSITLISPAAPMWHCRLYSNPQMM